MRPPSRRQNVVQAEAGTDRVRARVRARKLAVRAFIRSLTDGTPASLTYSSADGNGDDAQPVHVLKVTRVVSDERKAMTNGGGRNPAISDCDRPAFLGHDPR